MIKKLEQTTQFIQKQLEGFTPELGIILGSGLGNFAEQVENKKIISYSDIPNFPMATVKGHAGKLICGTIGQTKVAVFQGRFHYYEGHNLEDVVLPTRILAKLGTKALILTNAAGGINKDFAPGELVAITDHLNLTGNSPLIGPNPEEL